MCQVTECDESKEKKENLSLEVNKYRNESVKCLPYLPRLAIPSQYIRHM